MDTPSPGRKNAPQDSIAEKAQFGTLVGRVGITSTVGSFFTLAVLVVYVLLKLWPHPTPSGATLPTARVPAVKDSTAIVASSTDSATGVVQQGMGRPGVAHVDSSGTLSCDSTIRPRRYALAPPDSLSDPECVSMFGMSFPVWAEQRLLLLTLLSGALGALIHALRSIGWYVGNRKLVTSWLPYYMLLPLTGGLIAVAFYLVVRGGFFSPSGSFRDTSPLGFSAMGVLVGMFSTPAALKLQQLAETLLTRPGRGQDAVPQVSVSTAPSTPASPATNTPAATQSNIKPTQAGERGDLQKSGTSDGAFG